jgi:uncharacterized membrane protein YdbT with pleckstrin-like domain
MPDKSLGGSCGLCLPVLELVPAMNTPAPSGIPSAPETDLWTGHSSQWIHFWFYFFCVLLAIGCLVAAAFTAGLAAIGLVVPLVMWIARWWVTKTTLYELTSQRLRKSSGIFNRVVDELELFRVKDYSMEQPFFLRMLGLGNLRMVTSDATTPIVAIKAIPNVQDVREKLRNAVQAERDRKRVRQFDVDDTDDAALM